MFTRPQVKLNAPPTSHVLCGAICSALCFFTLPFLLWRISDGYGYSAPALSWFEIAFHLLILLY